MNNSEVAIAIIKLEHRALDAVLHAFQALLSKVAEGQAAAEFSLFSAMLFYIDDFQERCHHPKEDEYLFKSLRAATSEFDDIIDGLQEAHVSGAYAISRLNRCLVHYQGGARDGLERFKAGIDSYAANMHDHMRREEDLLGRSCHVIREQDWARIAAAFDENDDPLFGNNRRDEFTRLYQRIVLLAPQKVKLQLYPASRAMRKS